LVSMAAQTAAAPSKEDVFAGLAFDKDIQISPLSPESLKKHSAAGIQIYSEVPAASGAPAAGSVSPKGETWKCPLCSWPNKKADTVCYLCKGHGTGKKATKPSAFADKLDINAGPASPSDTAKALDELLGKPAAAPGSGSGKAPAAAPAPAPAPAAAASGSSSPAAAAAAKK